MAELTEAQREAKRKRDKAYRDRLRHASQRAALAAGDVITNTVFTSVAALRANVLKAGRGIAVTAPSGFDGIVARVYRNKARLVTETGTHLYGGGCKHFRATGYVPSDEQVKFEFVGGGFEVWSDGYTGTLHSVCHRQLI